MKTVIQILPSLDHSGGGVEKGTLDVAKELAEKKFRSIIISSGGNMAEKHKHKGVIHIKLSLNRKNIFSYFKVKNKIVKIFLEQKPDLVHIRSRWPAFCINKIVKQMKIPLVTTYHGTYSGNTNFFKKKYNSLMTEGDKVIAISDFIKEEIKKHFPRSLKRTVLINRGIDISYFDKNSINDYRKEQQIKNLFLPDKKHIILLPGRITRWKGHEVAIKAASIITKKNPELNFLLIFVGSEQTKKKYLKSLKKKIIDLNLQNKILLAGTQNDMPSIYSLSDVVISTSIEPEAFGRVSAEASSMEKPIIATDHGGSKNIVVNRKTGFLVEPKSPEKLAKLIVSTIKKSQKEKDIMGKKARERISQKFNLNKMLKQTLNLYEELIYKK